MKNFKKEEIPVSMDAPGISTSYMQITFLLENGEKQLKDAIIPN